ncbi:synaptogenesis protein syg-1-like [Saccoglossus kowalevskii]
MFISCVAFLVVVSMMAAAQPPDILIGPEDTLAYVGETVVMKCTVSSGQPKWYRVVPGGSDMQLSDEISVLNPYQIVGDQSRGEYFLQIPNVQVSDSNSYQWELFNADRNYSVTELR